jgi:DNA-binding response OmpR family regulator
VTNKRILIVEDDADMRLGYQVLLEAHKYQTFFAANAEAALSESRKRDPGLIILDLGLPAIDGFDILEHLGRIYLGRVPLIVVSGRELHGNKERAFKAGAKAYLQKPWNDNELLAIVERLAKVPERDQPMPSTGAPAAA